jgi:hypothetical protein
VGAPQGLIDQIDQVIAFFNKRRMDLPDGFFDRRAQFVINGTAFETLLNSAPNDPLVMMLARGPAGYRFTAKALQHAIPDANIERGEVLTDGDPTKVTSKLWLSGKLRDSGETINSLVAVTLRLNPAGAVETAEATVDFAELEKIRKARASV